MHSTKRNLVVVTFIKKVIVSRVSNSIGKNNDFLLYKHYALMARQHEWVCVDLGEITPPYVS